MPEPRTDADKLPYQDRSVTFVRIVSLTELESCNDRATKRMWLAEPAKLFAAWTGRHYTDLFVLNREAARKALG